jgi:uncharacterized protein YdaU (DUF1376 family)
MSDPWFRFFPSDWMAGVSGLSAGERGVYISLIALMYDQNGPVPRDDARLARQCGLPKVGFIRAVAALIAVGKLIEKDGLLFNERAKNELSERENRKLTASRAINSRWQKHEQNQQSSDTGVLPENYAGNTMRARASQPQPEKEDKSSFIESSLRSDSSAAPENGAPDLLEKIEKPKNAEAKRALKAFGEAWNDLAATFSLPAIDSIKAGSARERSALRTLRDLEPDDGPDALLARIRGSPYLRGEVNGFRASFDWICNPTNFQKIMDGNYEDREKKHGFGQHAR